MVTSKKPTPFVIAKTAKAKPALDKTLTPGVVVKAAKKTALVKAKVGATVQTDKGPAKITKIVKATPKAAAVVTLKKPAVKKAVKVVKKVAATPAKAPVTAPTRTPVPKTTKLVKQPTAVPYEYDITPKVAAIEAKFKALPELKLTSPSVTMATSLKRIAATVKLLNEYSLTFLSADIPFNEDIMSRAMVHAVTAGSGHDGCATYMVENLNQEKAFLSTYFTVRMMTFMGNYLLPLRTKLTTGQ